jgi:enamine deaminase RidA (YjgF/YER057c/UK114 family)
MNQDSSTESAAKTLDSGELANLSPTAFLNPPTHPSPPFYTHIALTNLSGTTLTKATKLVTLAGQIGRSTTGHIPSLLADQVYIALRNVSLCLDEVGASRRDIIHIRQYVVGLSSKETRRKELIVEWLEGTGAFIDLPGTHFMSGEGKPPNTVLGVTSLVVDDALYEIEVVAAVYEQ